MIEHPNLCCTNPVHIFADSFAGMTRFRPLWHAICTVSD